MVETFIIDERYKVSLKLGHGGNADVFLAFDPINNRNVAIKYLNTTVSSKDDIGYQKYKQEIITMATIVSPYVVKIYDTGIFINRPYVVMEYVRGISLKELIQREGFLLTDEIYNFMIQILDGLFSCHQKGIIHRDLKPENIIVKPDGSIVIIDFGTAYVLEEDLNIYYNSERITGTLHYMAPEYIEHPEGSILVDIYALGISMFEMYTGKLPFTHPKKDPKEIFKMHRKQPLPNIKNINPNCPEPFEKIIIKACSKDPKNRYQNAYEFKNALIDAYNKYKHPEDYKRKSLLSKLFNKKEN